MQFLIFIFIATTVVTCRCCSTYFGIRHRVVSFNCWRVCCCCYCCWCESCHLKWIEIKICLKKKKYAKSIRNPSEGINTSNNSRRSSSPSKETLLDVANFLKTLQEQLKQQNECQLKPKIDAKWFSWISLKKGFQ